MILAGTAVSPAGPAYRPALLAVIAALTSTGVLAADQSKSPESRLEAKEPPPYLFAIEGVVIEAEWLKPEPTVQEELRRALGPPPILVPVERVSADGAIEVRTRVGRFCSNPLPSYITSGMIGALPPILPCFGF
jgi:hypothetical protein